MNLRGCKFSDTGFQELLQSKQMHSLEILVCRENKIKKIEGPYQDLTECTEKQLRKGVMKLKLLDVRQNKLAQVVQTQAVNFLRETVVLMWANPFECDLALYQ